MVDIQFINNGDKGLLARTTINQLISSSNVINTTYTNLSASVVSQTLLVDAFYRFSADPGLYGGTDVVIQAITTASLSLTGIGRFYNPKYDKTTPGYGIWFPYIACSASNLSGPFDTGYIYGEDITGNGGQEGRIVGTVFSGSYNYIYPTLGNWSTVTGITGSTSNQSASISNLTIPSYGIGDTTIWGGKVWTNLDGNIGTSINSYILSPTSWITGSYNTTDYNEVWDDIEYDFENNFISARKEDLSNNIVEQSYEYWLSNGPSAPRSIAAFQWGNQFDSATGKGLYANKISDSYIETINFRGDTFDQNTFDQYVDFRNNLFNFGSSFSNNKLSNTTISSNLFFAGNGFQFDSNILGNSAFNNNLGVGYGGITNNNLSNTYFTYNIFVKGSSFAQNFGNSNDINFNTFISSSLYQNSLNSSILNSNILNDNSSISYNTLTGESEISNNSFLANGRINSNLLTNNSSIANNTPGSISYNSLFNSYSLTGEISVANQSFLNGIIVGNAENEIFVRNQTSSSLNNTIYSHQSIFNPDNLTVLSGDIFIIEASASYYVLGDLINNGTIVNSGSLTIGGTLYNYGSITGPGTIN